MWLVFIIVHDPYVVICDESLFCHLRIVVCILLASVLLHCPLPVVVGVVVVICLFMSETRKRYINSKG